ncbi:MAG TPA: YdeI/OmpD-associated family protein [Polyangiaceae bacterium]|nr:YdeI/OmpD-associated family protein [Polyangiaceae bacterium]
MAPVVVDPKKVRAFRNEAAFEAWLSKHHASETELWIRIYKKDSGQATISAKEAIDVALCWGWIDAIRKSFDEDSFLQRYCPRKAKSVWSQINRDNVARLVAAGRMTPHGQRHVDAAQADGRWAQAYAPMRTLSVETLPADLLAAIAASPRAKKALPKLTKPELFALAFRTNAMKTPAGRARKIASLVASIERGESLTG